MSNLQEEKTLENLISANSDKADIPLEDLLSKARESVTPQTPSTNTSLPKRELSPLERAMEESKNKPTGMVVENADLEAGKDEGPKKDIIHNDNRKQQWEDSISELDENLRKREAVILLKKPANQVEYIELMDEIESVVFDDNGVASFPPGVEPRYCRIREEDEEINDFESLDEEFKAVDEDDDDEKEPELSEEAKKTIEVIIDKTGLGVDFAFNEEEKKKIQEAEVIKVKKVKTIDINAIRARKSNKSFQEVVQSYDYAGERTTICFPGSGFKAQLKGLTYGEYSDIVLSMETVTFDQYYKRLSIIYNKMTNISTGQFADFEDFLHNFAYTDISLALYALMISTEIEHKQVVLHCGNNKCKKSFDWEYQPRTLLRLEKCGEKFLNGMKQLATADAADYDMIRENSPVNQSELIELPYSKLVVEVGVASAYQFLYNFIPLLDADTFAEAFGNRENNINWSNMLLLTTIRSVWVPDGDEYVECTGYKDILDAIYRVSPEEVYIITSYVNKYPGAYESVFSFGNVVCPHCGTVTKNLEVDMDTLVFQTYQRLMSTEIEFETSQDS